MDARPLLTFTKAGHTAARPILIFSIPRATVARPLVIFTNARATSARPRVLSLPMLGPPQDTEARAVMMVDGVLCRGKD